MRFNLLNGLAGCIALILTSLVVPAALGSNQLQGKERGGVEEIDPVIAPPSTTAFFDLRQNNARGGRVPVSVWASQANPVILMFSSFDDLWVKGTARYSSSDLNNLSTDLAPSTEWDRGYPTALGERILSLNVAYVAAVTAARTPSQAEKAYLDDRRKQPYGVIEGLGPIAPLYLQGSGAFTTINSVPLDAEIKKYDDMGNEAGVASSELGQVVTLIANLRTNASTEPSKRYFLYPRPYRLNEASRVQAAGTSETIGGVSFPVYNSPVQVLPSLKPVRSLTPHTDSGFISGHTNLSYVTAYALAYAVPERFQEILTRASDLGDSRIVAGMHSPLDVIGGRMAATAIAASNLCDPNPSFEKNRRDAVAEVQAYMLNKTGMEISSFLASQKSQNSALDPFSDWKTNKTNFEKRLTYEFPQIFNPNLPMSVPRCAETLLETRLPYLSAEQRRAVLLTTGLRSGFPLLDDAEGWGRLNVFAAADGYGAFPFHVKVTMDGELGGFHKKDTWKNDISGQGGLIKEGSGTLILAGHNSYEGATRVLGGKLGASASTALGQGSVFVTGGTLENLSRNRLTIAGDYHQTEAGSLTVNVGSDFSESIQVRHSAHIAGILSLVFDAQPAEGTSIEILKSQQLTGTFSNVQFQGLLLAPAVHYTSDSVILKF